MSLVNVELVNKIVALWVNEGAEVAAKAYTEASKELGLSSGKAFACMDVIEKEYAKCLHNMSLLEVSLGNVVHTVHGIGVLIKIEYYTRLNEGETRYIVLLDTPHNGKDTLAYWRTEILKGAKI